MEITPEQEKRPREIEWEFHVRTFGEELARVNFLPVEDRKACLERCRQRARAVIPKSSGPEIDCGKMISPSHPWKNRTIGLSRIENVDF